MRPRKLRRLLACIGAGAVLTGAGIGYAVDAHAAPANCEAVPWPTLLNWGQKRTICDGPILPDGSWSRGRVLWVPAHQVPFRCYYNSFSSSCSGGYFVDDTVISEESYPCWPDNLPPQEPGHLGGPVVAR